jgi:hypothetical protein
LEQATPWAVTPAVRQARAMMNRRTLLDDLDLNVLGQMPRNTLGGAYGRFMKATGYAHDLFAPLDRFRFPDSKAPAVGATLITGNSQLDWVRRWTRQNHDLGHLISEYCMMAKGFAIPAKNEASAGNNLLKHRQTYIEEMAYRAFLMAQTHHPISAPAVAEWIKDMPRYFNSIEGLSTHRGMLVFEELAHRAITDGTLDATRALHPRMKQIVREELFEGNRSLFEGLYADQHWDWSVANPVVRLSFGAGVLMTPEDLAASIHEQVSAWEKTNALPPEMPDIRSRFKRLLIGLHEKTVSDRLKVRESLFSIVKHTSDHSSLDGQDGMTRVTLRRSRVRESRTPGSVRAKAEWLSYSTLTGSSIPPRYYCPASAIAAVWDE